MTPTKAFAGLVAVILVAGPAAPRATAQEADSRILAVENGLRAPVQVEGRETVRWSLVERMEYYDIPGVSVAVLEGGEVVWARGWGLADPELGRPVTPETLFQAGSISKPVAAMAALSLVEEGLLALGEDVNRYLKRWKVPENRFTRESPVTLRRLLSHTAGVTVGGFPGYPAGEALPLVTEILDGAGQTNTDSIRVDTLPGSLWRYSGGGYTVMQLLLEDVTGRPFAEVVRERVLEPADMVHSTYVQPLPDELHGWAAHAHDREGRKLFGDWHSYPEKAAAGLWTTPSDLARLAMEVQKSLRGESNRILSRDMTEKMLTPGQNDWGLGFAIEGEGTERRFVHGGSNAGFRAQFAGWVDGGRGAFVMANGEWGASLIREVVFSVADVYGWPEPRVRSVAVVEADPGKLEEVAGPYRVMAWEFRVNMVVRDGSLWLEYPSGGPQKLLPVGEDRFVNLDSGEDVVFERDGEGEVMEVRVGTAMRAVPVEG